MITSSSSLSRKSPRSHEPPHYQQSPGRSRQRSSSSSSATAPPQPSSRRSSHIDSALSSRTRPASTASPAASASSSTHAGHFSPSRTAPTAPARFPSPPLSSSPAATVLPPPPADDANIASMEALKRDDVSSTQSTVPVASAPRQQPSPPSDDYRVQSTAAASAAAPQLSAGPLAPPIPAPAPQNVVHITDLAHITTLVQEGKLGGSATGSSGQTRYEISAMPINDVIDMVAALLSKITTTNDLQHDAMQRNVAHQQQANQNHDSAGAHMTSLSHSVLAFHGKNVPAISILSYLGRIHKYCPTTYEVFLSLLVYFDRMTERVNDRVVKTEQARHRAASLSHTQTAHSRSASRQVDTTMRDTAPADNSDETDSDLADDDDDDDDDDAMVDSPTAAGERTKPLTVPEERPAGPATYFVVDSFNIHRLIISGVTCASKFFSDVFYTNSRYAKVCGHCFHPTMLVLTFLGRRSPSCRTQPPGAAVSHPQRLPTRYSRRGAGRIRNDACRVLRPRGGGQGRRHQIAAADFHINQDTDGGIERRSARKRPAHHTCYRRSNRADSLHRRWG